MNVSRKIKLTSYFLLVIFLLVSLAVHGEDSAANYDTPTIFINGEYVACDVAPRIENGRTLVPIRTVAQYFEFNIKWDGEARRVEIKAGEDVLELFIDQTRYLKNGLWKELDVAAKIVDGRTLVPLRLISEEFGFEVEWHPQSRLISITKNKVVEAKNAEELLNAIDSYTTILLTGEMYNLSQADYTKIKNSNLRIEPGFDGNDLIIVSVSDLCIEAMTDSNPSVVVEPRYSNVLTFDHCSDIKLKNLTLGHTPDQGECIGGVVKFVNSIFSDVENCRLYGCGTYGIIADSSSVIGIYNTEIYDCTYGLLDLYQSDNIVFDNCIFRDTEQYGMFVFNECSDIVIRNSQINNNFSGEWSAFIENYDCRNITFENCNFKNNNYSSFFNNGEPLDFINCSYE